MLKFEDFKKMKFDVIDTSKTVGGVDDGIETTHSKLEYSSIFGDLDCVEYGDWYSTC